MTLSERKALIQKCTQSISLPLWRVRGLNANRDAVLRIAADPSLAADDCEENRPLHPGDTFFIQEAWTPAITKDAETPLYKSDYTYTELNSSALRSIRWNAPGSMPREYARLYFQVAEIKLERLKSAKVDDLLHEGVPCCTRSQNCYESCQRCSRPCSPKAQYQKLWDQALKENKDQLKYEANPLTWVISLRKL